jgi:hypothetical protein
MRETQRRAGRASLATQEIAAALRRGESIRMYLLMASGLCVAVAAHANEKSPIAPGCSHESPQQCVTAALEAMGSRDNDC